MSLIERNLNSSIVRPVRSPIFGSWNNLEYDYESNFSSGVDGWGAAAGIRTGNIDGIGGRNDCLRFYADGTAATHRIPLNQTMTAGRTYLLMGDIFIPSGQTNVDGFLIDMRGKSQTVSVLPLDTWYRFVMVSTPTSTGSATIYQLASGSLNFTGANLSTDDAFYFHSVKLIQVT